MSTPEVATTRDLDPGAGRVGAGRVGAGRVGGGRVGGGAVGRAGSGRIRRLAAGAIATVLAATLASCGSLSRPSSVPAAPSEVSPTAALVTATTPAGTVTTTGVGNVKGTPDTMTLSIGVSSSAASATGALGAANSAAAAVQAALARDGVTASNLQTGGLSLQQKYPSGTGYQADEQLTATLHDLRTAGRVIDDAVAAAGNAGRLEGVGFSISATSPLLATARRQAVADARTQAEQLAVAAGEHLGALQSLSEQTQQGSQYPQFFASASAGIAASPAVPIQPGTQQLSAAVTAVWDLVP